MSLSSATESPPRQSHNSCVTCCCANVGIAPVIKQQIANKRSRKEAHLTRAPIFASGKISAVVVDFATGFRFEPVKDIHFMITKHITRRIALLACAAAILFAGSAFAGTQTDIPGPNGSGNFGYAVTVLPNGNIVVTDPYFDSPSATDVGAAYLYNSAGGLISTLTGSTASDRVGFNGVTVLNNGNYIVRSARWQNNGQVDAGAATWCSGTAGCTGTVSPANSLVGSSANDQVGNSISALSNGHYVVRTAFWDNGPLQDVGAVTWCDGNTGRSGTISNANSLIGTVAGDKIGNGGTRRLTNGNYVVNSPNWDNGDIADAGASTWCNGGSGCFGAVTTANSLYGSQANDQVGVNSAVALPNGNYVVLSRLWNNGATTTAGAATWCDGSTGRVGAVSIANSLVGTHADDQVGASGVALTNGNYVVITALWDNAPTTNVGAVTWCNGATGRTGDVSSANSLVGSTSQDSVGNYGVAALTNGNYVVNSPNWSLSDIGAFSSGAATWCNGTTGCTGAVSSANSLIGSLSADQVGYYTIALTNGNYVVSSPAWNNGPLSGVGAATWCNGTTGRTGPVSTNNSLVGNQFGDAVGRYLTPLANGNYVVGSDVWDNGPIADAGAVTWCDGTIGCTADMSAAKSLVGTSTQDHVGRDGITPLTNGNYVVNSSLWGNTDLGAVTWCDGTSGRIGAVSPANSLIGSHPNDQIGLANALSDGNYYVRNTYWDNGATLEAGAVTLARGDIELVGGVNFGNSVRGVFPNGGFYMSVAYNALSGQLIVGQPIANIVSLFASRGPDFIVTTVDDHNDGSCSSNDCTLREAIIAANAQADDNSITFASGVTGIIQLAGGLPDLANNVTLHGPGANVLTVRRNTGGIYRIFNISNGGSDGPVVSISGLGISNGQASSSGGGIQNDHGTLLLRNCALTGNSSMVSDSNTYGGAIFNWGGKATIEECTIAGNTANNGGGVASLKSTLGTAVLIIRHSTLSGNTASGGLGGGVYNEANISGATADVSLTNNTLSGNSATSAGFLGGAGGAIYNFGSFSGVVHMSVQDCTITGNNAPSAGGIYNRVFSGSAFLNLQNTILKTGTIGANFINADGVINSLGHNLSSDEAGGLGGTGPGGYLTGSGDIRNTNPLLGPLQDNGGPTFTHALLNGSPAINAAENASETSLDQRGYLRVGTNDIGAFEFGGSAPMVPILSAVSRKTHGAAGSFDINLPQSGPRGVECRTGGAGGNHQIIVTFASPVSVGGLTVTSVNGQANASRSVNGNVVTINLTGVANAQTLTITMTNVNNGELSGNVVIPMGVLFGDTTGNGSVTASDVVQTKNASGQSVSGARFRNDLNASGTINASDISAAKFSSGTALP
jgi:CSLREA domain-containing protein